MRFVKNQKLSQLLITVRSSSSPVEVSRSFRPSSLFYSLKMKYKDELNLERESAAAYLGNTMPGTQIAILESLAPHKR